MPAVYSSEHRAKLCTPVSNPSSPPQEPNSCSILYASNCLHS